MTSKSVGLVYALLCVSLWGLIPVVAKTGQVHLDHHQFLFWSSFFSFVTLLVLLIATKKAHHYKNYHWKDWIYLPFLGLLGTYVYYLFLYLGYSEANGIEVLVVEYLWPIVMVILSVIMLNEKLTLRKIIGIILGFVGVLAVISKGELVDFKVNDGWILFLVALSTGCFAVFSILSKSVKQETTGVVLIYFLAATVASFIVMMVSSSWAWPTAGEWLAVLLNGILVNGLSYVFWQRSLQIIDVSVLAPLVFIAPITSVAYLVLFFAEPFVFAYAIGIVLVLGGGLLNTIEPKRPSV